MTSKNNRTLLYFQNLNWSVQPPIFPLILTQILISYRFNSKITINSKNVHSVTVSNPLSQKSSREIPADPLSNNIIFGTSNNVIIPISTLPLKKINESLILRFPMIGLQTPTFFLQNLHEKIFLSLFFMIFPVFLTILILFNLQIFYLSLPIMAYWILMYC